ncbi:MAG: 3-keto-5-aminohexanoate cleavage protein [Planctomycetota bacterium]|nr:MAG: 3-keto-5-aminohexanoate cleavage protein [Planctomycetota bacterium]
MVQSRDTVRICCALTGVLTDPRRHPVPVTPEQMARAAREAVEAGAAIVHVHFRNQAPGMGHLPSWEPEVAAAICEAIRAACPGVVINMSTGVLGDDVSGPVGCLERVRPEMAALNCGSLNYLKLKRDGSWAWPPLLFDNPVGKIERLLEAMRRVGAVPECECFDTGIVRSTALFQRAGMLRPPVHVSFVMGVASGMPAKAAWLPLLIEELPPMARWQLIAIGQEEVWPLLRRAAELGGDLRTGLEDTFYLPDGSRARSNGELVEALVALARAAGREPASPAEVRAELGGEA